MKRSTLIIAALATALSAGVASAGSKTFPSDRGIDDLRYLTQPATTPKASAFKSNRTYAPKATRKPGNSNKYFNSNANVESGRR